MQRPKVRPVETGGRIRRTPRYWAQPGAVVRALAIPLALIISGTMVWGASAAAFTSTTDAGGNSWTTATVILRDDDGGPAGAPVLGTASASALFDVEKVVPGFKYSRCIKVSSDSSVPTRLKMYGTGTAPWPLAEALRVTVEEGSDAAADGRVDIADPSCAYFQPDAVIFDYPLGWLPQDFSNGLSSEGTAGYLLPSGGHRSFRFTISLPVTATNRALEGTSMEGTFIWEARSVAPAP